MDNLNINDLSIMLAAIDIAVKRGAYSVLEVGTIGNTAERLNAFLKAAAEAAEAAKAEQTSTAAADQAEAVAYGAVDPEAPAA